MKKWILLLCLISCSVLVGAFETYGTGSDYVDDLDKLYTQAGMVFPTASFPVDKEELYTYAVQLRRRCGSREIRTRIDKYLEDLAFTPDQREIVSQEQAAFEQYMRGDSVYDRDFDYYRSYIEMTPFFSWALSAGTDGSTGIHVSAELMQQNNPAEFPDNNLFEHGEENPVAIENYFITSGYMTHRSGELLLQLGRTPVHFGGSGFSSLLPSDRLPYLDAFYYTWRFGPLKMTSFVSSLYNGAGASEIDDINDEGLPNILPIVNGVIEYNDGSGDHFVAFDSTMILTAMHRFEWAFERLRLGMTALHISSREYNAFHIGDIFPVFSWHNGEVGVHNMSLVLEASYIPISGLELYAQAGYDDINSEDITGVGDTSIPTIPGYILGTSYSHSINQIPVTYRLEGGFTHYLWGNFHDFDPERGNYLSRAIYRYLRDEERIILLPLTSPYGPGAVWINGGVDIEISPSWNITLAGETVFRNTQANLVTTPYEASDEVAGAAMEMWGYYTAQAEYSHDFSEMGRFSVYVRPALLVRDVKAWLELSIGATMDLQHRATLSN